MKRVRYIIEAFLAYVLFAFFWAFPIKIASFMGGWLARKIGPITSAHQTAVANINQVFPDYNSQQVAHILNGMWDNLGRTVAEMPHLKKMTGKNLSKYVELDLQIPANTTGTFFVSAHYGNWELAGLLNSLKDIEIAAVQRKMNNPYTNNLLVYMRRKVGTKYLIEKSNEGVRQIIKLLKDNTNVGALVDQRHDNGVKCQFMGLDATASNLPEKLYNKNICKLAFIRVERLKGCSFKISVYSAKFDKNQSITQSINDEFASWIRQNPEQWFWVHNRWKALKPR